MKKLALFATGLLLAAAVAAVAAGCRGSVDRVYDDAPGLAGDGGGATVGLDGGDGGVTKEHADASDDGPPPATAPARITVTVSGLFGTGLVLQNNGADDLPVQAPGAITFTTLVPPGQPYKVTVANQPTGPSQTCTVVNGEGTAQGRDVTDVLVNCVTAIYPVGGTVVGLDPGKSVVLQNNGGNDITVDGNVAFAFPGVPSGADFNVTIKSSPGSTCTVSGGKGTVVAAAVDSVVINCLANSYTIGGTVTGLTGTLVLQNNGGNDRTVTTSTFAFSTPIKDSATYNVTVKTQPKYPPQNQTCMVTKGSGTVAGHDVTDVAVSCTTTKYTVGGTVNGLTGSGLELRNNGGDDKSIAGSGGFTFATPIASGSSYNVSIVTQPAGQVCSVTNPTGTVTTGNVTGVVVNCSTPIALSENFDAVVTPALPAGWTSVSLLNGGGGVGGAGANAWTTVRNNAKSPPNAAWVPDLGVSTDIALVSPAFVVGSATAKLTFSNQFVTEEGWDGGVLEIAIAGGAWQDIVDAGGSFNAGGYNVKLLVDGSNTIGGRNAWNGKGNVITSVNLPAAAAGRSVQLRWRFGSDDGASAPGWWIDDVVVTN